MADINLGKVKGTNATINGKETLTITGETPINAELDSSNPILTISLANAENLATKDDLSSFITNTVSDLINYYTKDETYDRDTINIMVSSAVSGIFSVVDELPEIGETNVIYLVTNPDNNLIKDEWIWVADTSNYELIGTTNLNLSGYVTSTWVENKLNFYVETTTLNTILINYHNANYIDTALNNKLSINSLIGSGNIAVSKISNDVVLIAENGTIAYEDVAAYNITHCSINNEGNPDTLKLTDNILTIEDCVLRSSKGKSITALADTINLDLSKNGDYEVYYKDGEWRLYAPEIISNITPVPPSEPSGTTTVPWIQPILTSDGVWGEDKLAVRASSVTEYAGNLYLAWKAFDNKSTEGDSWATAISDGLPQYIEMSFSPAISVSVLSFQNRNTEYKSPIKEGKISIQKSNSGELVDLTTFTNTDSKSASIWDVVLTDANDISVLRITCEKAFGLYADIDELYITATQNIGVYDATWVDINELKPTVKTYDGENWILIDAYPPVGRVTILDGVATIVSYYPNASFKYLSYGNKKTIPSGGGSGGVSAHNELNNRDLPNQHPISAITNLATELDDRNNVITSVSINMTEITPDNKNINITIPEEIFLQLDLTIPASQWTVIEAGQWRYDFIPDEIIPNLELYQPSVFFSVETILNSRYAAATETLTDRIVIYISGENAPEIDMVLVNVILRRVY